MFLFDAPVGVFIVFVSLFHSRASTASLLARLAFLLPNLLSMGSLTLYRDSLSHYGVKRQRLLAGGRDINVFESANAAERKLCPPLQDQTLSQNSLLFGERNWRVVNFDDATVAFRQDKLQKLTLVRL
jgi:hypothetical protein